MFLSDHRLMLKLEVLPPASTPMTKAEASLCVEQINNSISQTRQLLVELEIRAGFIALGFTNMSQLMRSGLFSKARSTLQKELKAGRMVVSQKRFEDRKSFSIPVAYWAIPKSCDMNSIEARTSPLLTP